MSTSEHYDRMKALEQSPDLVQKLEGVKWSSIASETPQNIGSNGDAQAKVQSNNWPDPAPLGGELPSVPSFDAHLLPTSLRALAEDTTERMRVPLDYPAAVAVLCLAGATNRRATIQPKAKDTSWTVVPNLWGGIIAPPSQMKSPVIGLLTQPLTRIESDWRNANQAEQSLFAQQREEAELQSAAWREQYKASVKSGKESPARPAHDFLAPTLRRLITQDATFESLHAIMAENPAGIFVIRDELTGWLAGLERQGREQESGLYLQAWNGDTGFTIDRIGRGSIHVEACCVSILGGIQPSRLRTYLSEALKDGPSNDGLMQRFQVLVYPDPPRDWRYVDRPPNSAAIESAEQVYRRLANMDPAQPLRLRFEPSAQELFIAWLGELEGKLRADKLHPALVCHLAKYRSLMPSLALLFEVADGGAEEVSLLHAQQAAALCEYLEGHAQRVYSMIISPERLAAAELGSRLAKGWKGAEGMFTVRDVYQNDWRGLFTPNAVRRALVILGG